MLQKRAMSAGALFESVAQDFAGGPGKPKGCAPSGLLPFFYDVKNIVAQPENSAILRLYRNTVIRRMCIGDAAFR